MIHWLSTLIAPLNDVLFTFGNDAVSWAELLGFLTGGVCVWLTVKAHVANFAVGIANSALFLVLFVSSRLWSDASLQIVFIGLGVVGWWQWVRGSSRADELVITRAGARTLIGLVLLVGIATGLLTWLLRAADDTAPFWDALTTALSLAAQWLLNAKKIQTWWFWVAADLIYIPLYSVKHLDLTALIYVLFLGLCVSGWRQWRQALPAASIPAPEVAVR